MGLIYRLKQAAVLLTSQTDQHSLKNQKRVRVKFDQIFSVVHFDVDGFIHVAKGDNFITISKYPLREKTGSYIIIKNTLLDDDAEKRLNALRTRRTGQKLRTISFCHILGKGRVFVVASCSDEKAIRLVNASFTILIEVDPRLINTESF
jgi:hypothetical protein